MPPIKGYTDRGEYVRTHVIRSGNGSYAEVLTLGARLHDLRGPGGESLVVQHGSVDDLNNDTSYLNAVAGRVANRLAGGMITAYGDVPGGSVFDGLLLSQNEGDNTLHGGVLSWDRRLFSVDSDSDDQPHRISMSMESPDGDNGFPSTVRVTVTYEFTAENTLTVTVATRNTGSLTTVTNATLHTYFDLTGANGTVQNAAYNYTMHAPRATTFLPVDSANIPTGEIVSVTTPPGGYPDMDFTTPRTIAVDYDYFWAVDSAGEGCEDELNHLVTITAPPSSTPGKSGTEQVWRVGVHSNQPGFQMYTAKYLNSPQMDEGFKSSGSVAIEPSLHIDAGNHANFPSTVLQPGESRTQVIAYVFDKVCV